MIQIARLEGFYWVARTQGYARAARAFPYPITQPGVHQQVRRLEEEVGTRLFERVGKDKVVLTPAGRALYAFVAPFYEQLPNVIRGLEGGELSGTLRIHASAHVLRHLLPEWLRRLQQRRPEISIELGEVKTADLTLLRSGETDLLVDHLPEVPEDIEARQLATVHPFLVLPANHREASRKHLRLGALGDETFVGYSTDRRLRELQLECLALHEVTPKKMLLADSSETILGFVAAGLGYSLVPSLLERGPKVPGVVAQRLERPAISFPVYAAWRKSAVANPLIQAALAELPPGTVRATG